MLKIRQTYKCTHSVIGIFLKKTVISVITVLAATLPVKATAKQSADTPVVTLSAPKIDGLLERGINGPYTQLFDMLVEAIDTPLKLEILPTLRSEKSFVTGTKDCLYLGINDPNYYQKKGVPAGSIIFSDPIHTISIKVFTLPEQPMVSSFDDLAGTVFAAERGVVINLEAGFVSLPDDIIILEVESVEAAFKLLDAHRVTAAISFDLDAQLFMGSQALIKNYNSDPKFALYSNDEVLVCHNNEIGEQVISGFNLLLQKTKSNGVFQRIFNRQNHHPG